MHVLQELERVEWVYSGLGCDFRWIVNVLDVLYYSDREGKKDIRILSKDILLVPNFDFRYLFWFVSFLFWLRNDADKKQKQTHKATYNL